MFDKKTKEIILEIIQAYDKGENIVSLAKDRLTISDENSLLPILLSYDLQAGSYNKNKNNNLKVFYDEYGHQLAEIINTYSSSYNTIPDRSYTAASVNNSEADICKLSFENHIFRSLNSSLIPSTSSP